MGPAARVDGVLGVVYVDGMSGRRWRGVVAAMVLMLVVVVVAAVVSVLVVVVGQPLLTLLPRPLLLPLLPPSVPPQRPAAF